jgi:hypothetical protein
MKVKLNIVLILDICPKMQFCSKKWYFRKVFEPVNLDVEEDEEDEGDEPEDEEPGAGVVVRVDLPGNKK